MDEEVVINPVNGEQPVGGEEPGSKEMPVNGEHLEMEDEADAPLRSPPPTAPKPSRESRGSMVFSKYFLYIM